MLDNDYNTRVIIPPIDGYTDGDDDDTLNYGQFFRLDWSSYGSTNRVGAFWLHIDEELTTSGSFYIYVLQDSGWTLIPSELFNGVGTDGKGGVFNLGGYDAKALYLTCWPLCYPNLVIHEVKMWK